MSEKTDERNNNQMNEKKKQMNIKTYERKKYIKKHMNEK